MQFKKETEPLILKIIFVFFCWAGLTTNIAAQLNNPEIYTETGFLMAQGDNIPFWLLTNRYGLIRNENIQAYGKISAYAPIDSSRNIGLGYGFGGVGRLNRESDFYADEWYADIKLFNFKFTAGSKRKVFGLQDPDLSSGGIIWSGNARPLPEISLSTFENFHVPLTKEFLSFSGGISHGWFDNHPSVKDVFLHHKWLVFQTREDLKWKISAGLHHYAQWGGYTDRFGDLPNDLKTFWRVFIANAGHENAPVSEQLNAVGNHLGSYNFRFDYKFEPMDVGIYWQSIFEDNSGRKLRNLPDGLYGLIIHFPQKNSLISSVLFEFLNTDYQSGYIAPDSVVNVMTSGGDNYFTHHIYNMGWTAYGMTIGTPFISSPVFDLDDPAISNSISNNRIKAFHTGISGIFLETAYKIFYSYSINKGSYRYPFDPFRTNHSMFLSFHRRKIFNGNSDLTLELAADVSNLFGNNCGFAIKWMKPFL